jgi:UPF0755 protein
VIVGLCALLVAVLGGGVYLARFAEAEGPLAGSALEIDVPEGASSSEIAALLHDQGAVSSRALMAVYLWLSPRSFAPGNHLVDGGASPRELSQLLARSDGRPKVKVTIPEGFTMFAIAERLEKLRVVSRSEFLRIARDPQELKRLEVQGTTKPIESAEGYLFPATYEFPKNCEAASVLERMVRESNRRWARIAEDHEPALLALQNELGWSRFEILTLASLVEKEAAVDDERPIIASVFLNRLTRDSFTPKLLQSDPSSAYDCLRRPTEVPSCKGFEGKVTPAMNRDKLNQYSTYTNVGLPPGPIANPGERSLRAVLAPAHTDYLFFVAKGGGRHTFSESLAEHDKAIKR